MSEQQPLTRRQLREREREQLVARIATAEPGASSAARAATASRDDAPAAASAPMGAAQSTPASAASAAATNANPTSATNASAAPPIAAPSDPAAPRNLVLRDPAIASARATAPRVQRPPAAPAAPKPRRRARRGLRGILSAGILVVAGAFLLGVSVPASAFFVAQPQDATLSVADTESQSVQTVFENDVVIERDEFGARSAVENQAAQRYAHSGIWTPTTGSVRWPFPYTVGISSWYGPRKTTIPGVSSFHKGIDFTPGEGAPTYAIADGVVEMSSVSPYGLGNEVIIDHVIDGVQVQSVYGHMEMNSSPLRVGDKVKVGDLVGKTGSTGTVTGANMHLEIHVNGTPVEPFSWLKKNARND